jgi:hypothetical protein
MVRFADALEGHSGRRRFRPCLDEIIRSQLVLSGLWRRGFCDASRVVGASAHIAGRTLSRHHGEGVVRENLRRENGSAEARGSSKSAYICGCDRRDTATV